jgi:hypothetical protein
MNKSKTRNFSFSNEKDMVVVIKTENPNAFTTILLIVTVVIAIILVLLVLWIYLFYPWIKSLESSSSNQVKCTVAPNTPIGLTGAPSSNTIVASWTATSNTDSYNVYLSNVQNFNKGTAQRIVPSTTNNVTIVNLVPITYYIAVTAVNSCGESALSTPVTVIVTTWPLRIKLCKQDDPVLCLSIPDVIGQYATVSQTCSNNSCTIDYINQQKLALNPADSFCVQTNFIAIPNIEQPVPSESCTSTTTQNWNINLLTGQVSNVQGLCLGADDNAETYAFNTDCNLLNPTDTRYLWTVQAI